MAWIAASGSMKALHDDRDESLLGLGSPAHSSFTPESNRGGNKKRSQFHIVKEEIEEDDCSDELSNPAEKKRRLTADQVKFLEMSFNEDLKLEPERKVLLAKDLGILPRQVAIWFQNRRARWKNKQLEQDFEALKAKYDILLNEKENILIEHEKAMEENKLLQDQIVQLTMLLGSPTNGGERHDRTGSGGSEGKSESTSPTKSTEDQNDVQDSGQSSAASEEGTAGGEEMLCRTYGDLNPAMDCLASAAMEEGLAPTDIISGNIPLVFHYLAGNTIYLDDGFFFNFEDHFTGLA